MKVVIERAKWARGQKNGESELLNMQGNMCCLGFAGSQLCGLTRAQLFEAGSYPNDPDEWEGPLAWLNRKRVLRSGWPEHVVDAIVNINDDTQISDEKREKLLKKHFAEHGIEVEFI